MASLNAGAKEFTPSFALPPVPSQPPSTSGGNIKVGSGSRDPAAKGGTPGRGSKGRALAHQNQGATHSPGAGQQQQQDDREAASNKSRKDASGKSRGRNPQQQELPSKDKAGQSRRGSKGDDHIVGALTSELSKASINEDKRGDEARGSGSRKKAAAQKNEKPVRQDVNGQAPPPLNRSKSSSTSVATSSETKSHRGAASANTGGTNKKTVPPNKKPVPGALSSTNRRPSMNVESNTSTGTSSSSTATASTIIPGMEPTTFICLTDVIHPVRHIVKDGVSIVEQGSDAYLDWIVRSLSEHEEITVIGMDAAIPDVISLVLRAGRMGIGYQEVRTFTTQDALGGNKSCLQFRMTQENGYIPLAMRPPPFSIN